MIHVDKSYFNPQVNLKIEGVIIPQVLVNFGSKVKILPRTTLVKISLLELEKYEFYLKVSDQGVFEPLGI